MSASARPPVIIIGMHRSGTSMLCRLLERLGLFVGEWKQWNNESPFFQMMNEWLLRRCGSTYKSLQPFRAMLGEPDACSAIVATMERLTRTFPVALYLGWRKYQRYGNLKNLDIPWGWKDPRSTVTLPLWLKLFPNAKVIHIFRHGVDVARSLLVRRSRPWNRLIAFCEEIQIRSWRSPVPRASLPTRRLTTLTGGFTLWEEYMEEARTHVRHLGNRAMEVKYEDFLRVPHGPLESLAQFANLNVTSAEIDQAVKSIRLQRAYAYLNDGTLRAFAEQVTERLSKYGY